LTFLQVHLCLFNALLDESNALLEFLVGLSQARNGLLDFLVNRWHTRRRSAPSVATTTITTTAFDQKEAGFEAQGPKLAVDACCCCWFLFYFLGDFLHFFCRDGQLSISSVSGTVAKKSLGPNKSKLTCLRRTTPLKNVLAPESCFARTRPEGWLVCFVRPTALAVSSFGVFMCCSNSCRCDPGVSLLTKNRLIERERVSWLCELAYSLEYYIQHNGSIRTPHSITRRPSTPTA
jgi:hypothetical protein